MWNFTYHLCSRPPRPNKRFRVELVWGVFFFFYEVNGILQGARFSCFERILLYVGTETIEFPNFTNSNFGLTIRIYGIEKNRENERSREVFSGRKREKEKAWKSVRGKKRSSRVLAIVRKMSRPPFPVVTLPTNRVRQKQHRVFYSNYPCGEYGRIDLQASVSETAVPRMYL